MNEAKIEKEFRKYKSQYIRLLGNHALSNDELDDVCKHLFGSKYRGSHPVDSKFQMKPGYYIINLDVASGPGTHWVAGYATKTTFYLFDSFARDHDKILPILTKRLRRAKYKIKSSDKKDAEQRATYKNAMVVTCGHSCISFLLCVHKHGIRAAMKI